MANRRRLGSVSTHGVVTQVIRPNRAIERWLGADVVWRRGDPAEQDFPLI
jgi:hypothetical protein